MNAVIHGHEDIVALLVDGGAQLDIQDKVGENLRTPPLSFLHGCDTVPFLSL